MKSLRLVFRPEAEAELIELYRYIALASGSIDVAFKFTERLRIACFTLVDFPERGAPRDEIKAGLRILTHERKTVIAYFVRGDKVIVNNIFHAGRDWEMTFLNDGDSPPPTKE